MTDRILEIVSNRKAFHDYHIEFDLEAGIELQGTEVKSIRARQVQLRGSHARIEAGQIYLYDADIAPYLRASYTQHEPKRKRKLLLHRKEIDRLFGEVSVGGRTLVPLSMYWKNGRVKVKLGVVRGKQHADKRQDLKEKAELRDSDRMRVDFNRRHGSF